MCNTGLESKFTFSDFSASKPKQPTTEIVITLPNSLEPPIIHKNNPKRKQIPKLNKKPTQNKNNKINTQKKLDTIKIYV